MSLTQSLTKQLGGDLHFDQLVSLARNRIGHLDVPCPFCSSGRKRENRKKPVARVWYSGDRANLYCLHCGANVFARSKDQKENVPKSLAEDKAKVAIFKTANPATQLRKARCLYRISEVSHGTIVQVYLREGRGIKCPLPPHLRFLPAKNRGSHPSMIAPFGIATEIEPGISAISPEQIAGVHLTFLRPDGSGKAQTEYNTAKIMIGRSLGFPIVIAPPNDGLGLVVTEGIEDALSAHEATGLGAWAAGSANRMPALAAAIPQYVETVMILAHDDDAGMRAALQLRNAIQERGIDVHLVVPTR
jgi:Toprim domain